MAEGLYTPAIAAKPCGQYSGSPGPQQVKPVADCLFENTENVSGATQPAHRVGPNYFLPPVARIIARMPALSASGSVGHASMIVPNSGSSDRLSASSAPDSAPLSAATPVFPEEYGGCSNPSPSANKVPFSTKGETRRLCASRVLRPPESAIGCATRPACVPRSARHSPVPRRSRDSTDRPGADERLRAPARAVG